ncbi:hypothetical protein QS306_15415 [Paraburkholderia bonniea]|uniref:tetratricopeptide repeat protein n=1 Tax=Paraburkholderia bonniea TaxID=2152891 RepID=UPI0012918131|nr:hypothetical protein [Paraburkholderia bonniea]WJF92143.1 hypothetical protein QS306_15415 [Paraburkholderia bonniea]WJF95463.1 hypothetical protein QS308_15420 [Paraburkholderia bonniea]
MTIEELEQQLLVACTCAENDPSNLEIMREVCEILLALKREDELLAWTKRALALNPSEAYFLSLTIFALNLSGQHAEAADILLHSPWMQSDPVRCRLQLGYSLMMAGDLAAAIPLLDEVLSMTMDASSVKIRTEAEHLVGEAMLKAGDPRGFAHWLMRNVSGSAGNYLAPGIPMWAGETDLHGQRVLITHQLGFGDNFLLAACLADWRAAGASLMMTCDAQIHALMQASLPDCEIVSAARPMQLSTALPDAVQARVDAFAPHLQATLLHLPLLKAKQAGAGYRFQAYLQAPLAKQKLAKEWAQQLRLQHPGKKLVGLFWDCLQRHEFEASSEARCWAKRRSMPVTAVDRIVTDPAVAGRIHFVNLQHPLIETLAGIPVGNVSRCLSDISLFDDTAACIGELDAVLAVDASISNLAAMMGKPTCVLVNTSSDWRWGIRGDTTSWIENATVLRQTHEGNWDPVVQEAVAWLIAPAIQSA